MSDATSLERTFQPLTVEVRPGRGSPPSYSRAWWPLFGFKVDRIEINRDNKPSTATIWIPWLRWDASHPFLRHTDMVRIRTSNYRGAKTILFQGFVTGYLSGFSGGNQAGGAFERNAFILHDYRWLLSATSSIFGQLSRGPDDYLAYGTDNQVAKDDSYTFLTGRRAIFNADGRPNRDPVDLRLAVANSYVDTPIFADPDSAVPWTARHMIRYVLSMFYNQIYEYLPISDPADLLGLDHSDFDTVLNHIVVEGLNALEAVQLICSHLGWGFREDYFINSPPLFVFYKLGAASGYTRADNNVTILHRLCASAVGDDVYAPVAAGEKMLWAMDLADDIRPVVNNPWGLGAPHRFEFTAELVPAWLDSDLVPDTSESNANLFLTEAQLQDITNPNSKSYYKYYHPRGSSFKRDVGRKWALNESGRYTLSDHDRGMPFDFSLIVPDKFIKDANGKRLFAPVSRQLLPALTLDSQSVGSIGIKIEFSFDGGSTWQVVPAAISSLPGECGIYIDEANLAELVDQEEGTISGGTLDGVQLNYWTSLCDDKLGGYSFKNGEWKTRVRVTASVQMDQRLTDHSVPPPTSGSRFFHMAVFDFSEKYLLAERASASQFYQSSLPAEQFDHTTRLQAHLDKIRYANQDASISGRFTLERLWLGDGSGFPDFAIGDCIERITGREFSLAAASGEDTVYPEIVQIIYQPEQQKMVLITRDLRFAEVLI